MKRIIDRILSYCMLLAPFVLSLLLLFVIQSMPETSGHGPGYQAIQQGGQTTAGVKDRVSILVILEIFALTLIIRPWEFPWRPSRFGVAMVVSYLWGSLIVPMSMHMGRLMGLHALGMMVLMAILPLCGMLLWGRNLIDGGQET